MTRSYVYVDGENHFIRTATAAKKLFGSDGALAAVAQFAEVWAESHPQPYMQDFNRFSYAPDIQFVWDYCCLSSGPGYSYSYPHNSLIRCVYFTTCVGDSQSLHAARVKIRNYGFEPHVIEERKVQKNRRVQSLDGGLIEKPKAVDIALAARMISDAGNNLFEKCHLFSSDGDFIPVVEAVRRTGKIVWVHGYADVLPKESPLMFVPDAFVDLGESLKGIAHGSGERIRKHLAAGDEPLTT
jgi:uncharacterized LabA/DUF88 family protein